MKFSNFFRKLRGVKEAEPAPVAAPVEKAPVAPPKVEVLAATTNRKVSAPASPYVLKGGAKTQSDWLLLQIGKTGRSFIALAEKNKLSMPSPVAAGEAFVRHDMTAALLGYRLVLTAYQFHQDVPSLEALRIVRTAMIGMLHRAVDITVEQTGRRDQRQVMLANAEDQFRFAESEVAAVCAKLRAKSSEPFAPFYTSLVPAFAAAESRDLHDRFGSIMIELYSKIEATMAARNHQITG